MLKIFDLKSLSFQKTESVTITILAGLGDLPKQAFDILKSSPKYKICIVMIKNRDGTKNNHSEFFEKNAEFCQSFYIYQVDEFFNFLKQTQTDYLLILGKVEKPNFNKVNLQSGAIKIIGSILKKKIFSDNFILKIISKRIEQKTGVKVVDLKFAAKNLLATKKDETQNKPSPEQILKIKTGMKNLEKISFLDLAQSIVISNAGILGIEGPEGTDNLIERCSQYYQNWQDANDSSKNIDRILVKSSKKNQTTKLDLPTIGINTVNMILKNNYSGIAIKKDSVIILDKIDVISTLQKHGKFLYVV